MIFSEKIYSIAPEENFLRKLAQFITDKTSASPIKLAKAKVFLPNRRSVNKLREEFIHINDKGASILPEIYAIGDIDENELEFTLLDDSISEQLKPAASKLERKAILTKLILDNSEKIEAAESKISLEHAANLANSLLRFFDEIEKFQLSFDGLNNIVPLTSELSEYWQKSLNFLSLVGKEYPEILKARGLMDPICRRNEILKIYSERLLQKNSDDFIFIAGTTGSQPVVKAFIEKLLKLENTYFFFPYIDRALDSDTWKKLAFEENHLNHQYLNFKLLEKLQISSLDINDIGNRTAHQSFVSTIFSPASEVSSWKDKAVNIADAQNIKLVECDNILDEAKIISLILREAVHDNKTALVICNNSQLAANIQSIMKKYGINIDYTAGKKLIKTPVAKFFLQLSKLAGNRFKTSDFLAFIKSPFIVNENIREFKNLIAKIEKLVIRPLKIKFCDAILDEIERHGEFSPAEIDMVRMVFKPLKQLQGASYSGNNLSISQYLNQHIETILKLNANIFSSDEGKELFNNLENLRTVKELAQLNDLEDYNSLLENIFSDVAYRSKYGFAERLIIASSIEARLQKADINIITDVNEGAWPQIEENNWLSEGMKKEFGLPGIELDFALASHDFTSALFAEKVFITRSTKAFGGSLNSPSPLLQRIKTFYETHGLSRHLQPEVNYFELIKNFDGEYSERMMIAPPAPKPASAIRPKIFSVTKIEKLFKNPYYVYASDILKLKPLDEVEEEENAGLFGTILHKIFESFVLFHGCDESKITTCNLLDIGNEILSAYEHNDNYHLWKSKFELIADWFVEQEKERIKNIKYIFTERKESCQVNVLDEVITIHAKADRIELWQDESLNIVDYKSNAPSENKVAKFLKPQLLLEAFIIQKLSDGQQNINLTYVDINKHEVNDILKNKVNDAVAELELEMLNLFKDLLDDNIPFLSNPYEAEDLKDKFDDYEHLSRVKEWK